VEFEGEVEFSVFVVLFSGNGFHALPCSRGLQRRNRI